jgi:hypothetical protein
MDEPDPLVVLIAGALSEHEPALISGDWPGDERIAFYEALGERVKRALVDARLVPADAPDGYVWGCEECEFTSRFSHAAGLHSDAAKHSLAQRPA